MPDVAKLFRLWHTGVTRQAIADEFGVKLPTIYKWAQVHKLPRRKISFQPDYEPPAPSPEDEAASGSSLALSPYVQARIQELQLGMPGRSA